AGHFDRNTFFNLNGAGTNINRLSNMQYAKNLINWLTGCNQLPCTPGAACDDGNACTINDVFDANCNCSGTFQDSDNDIVCDAADQCAGFDDLADMDSDGIPDGCDNCDNTTDGTSCDDGNPNTTNDVLTNCVCAGIPINQTDVWLEAECAEVGSIWSKVLDINASNDTFLLPPNNSSLNNPPTTTADLIRFRFDLSQSGTYKVFARTLTTEDGDDSFWVRANGGNWQRWNKINAPNYPAGYQWSQVGNWVNNEDTARTVTFNLALGANTIDFAWRERDARLDKIFVTLNGNAPTGFGADASNCPYCFVDTDGDGVCNPDDLCEGYSDVPLSLNLNPAMDSTYQAVDSIYSIAKIMSGLNISYKAGNAIVLGVGFEAINGSTFSASVEDCTLLPSAPTPINEAFVEQQIETRTTIEPPTKLTIYPNPFSNEFTLSADFAIANIRLFNFQGQLLKDQTLDAVFDLNVDWSDLPSGTYFLSVQSVEGQVVNTKIVKLID
ncbi:MAG: T9SS type A sorting domain-containing protein, partial [Bacteroidota bacterium]